MFDLPDKTLAISQDSQTLQNADGKQYCQYSDCPQTEVAG